MFAFINHNFNYQMNVNDFVKDPEAQDINLKAQITTCKS